MTNIYVYLRIWYKILKCLVFIYTGQQPMEMGKIKKKGSTNINIKIKTYFPIYIGIFLYNMYANLIA